jgi:hypothetical protein
MEDQNNFTQPRAQRSMIVRRRTTMASIPEEAMDLDANNSQEIATLEFWCHSCQRRGSI